MSLAVHVSSFWLGSYVCMHQRMEDAREVAERKGESKKKEHEEIGCNALNMVLFFFLKKLPM